MLGSSVYICYKKSQSGCKRIAYKPEVLDCFPPITSITRSLALNIPMFCLPMGALVESWPEGCKPAEKQFSTCVFTHGVFFDDFLGAYMYAAKINLLGWHKVLRNFPYLLWAIHKIAHRNTIGKAWIDGRHRWQCRGWKIEGWSFFNLYTYV
jgi:hypothetical protein